MNKYLELARVTGAFKDSELEVLEGVLDDYIHFPSEGYIILEENLGDKTAGFIIFGRAPLTAFVWDIYWLAVAKELQGNGFGKRLLMKVESYILQTNDRAIIRVETSSQKMFAHAHGLYIKQGFSEVARIRDFYSDGDDNIILCKDLRFVRYQ